MSWLYNDTELVEPPKGSIGFVYRIDINNCFYYGLKHFYSTRKKNYGKKKLATITDKRLKTYEMIKTESNWKAYCSSSDTVKALVMNGHEPVRRIVRICYSEKELSFYENKYLFNNIQDERCLNDSIAKRYFKKEAMEWQSMT